MHLLPILTLLSLPLALASNASKWAKLAATSKDGLIKLDSAAYDEITAGPRDYSLSVVLTALPEDLKCEPCR